MSPLAKYWDGAAWQPMNTGSIPVVGLASALPVGADSGQEIYYIASESLGIIWHLRYRPEASGSPKWEFLGGPPLLAAVDTNQSTTSVIPTWVTPPDALSLTLALPGTYDITIQANVWNVNSGFINSYDTYSVGGATPLKERGAASGVFAGSAAGIKTTRVTGITAGQTIAERVALDAAGTMNYNTRRLMAVPVRLG